MNELNLEKLKLLAEKYIWWKPVEDALKMPERVIAQVMNIGDYEDVQALLEEVGEEVFRSVLLNAEADFLHLPAGVSGAVIGDGEFESHGIWAVENG